MKRVATTVVGPVSKVLVNPGVVFSIANIPCFVQSDSSTAVVAAVATAIVAVGVNAAHQYPNLSFARAARWVGQRIPKIIDRQFDDALRVDGWTLLAPTLAVAATTQKWLSIGSGLFFSSGNFVATNSRCQAIQQDPEAGGLTRAATCPAVHWGIGYSLLGILAGGYNLQTALGILTTASSSAGFLLKKFTNPASPYMILVHATAINAVNAGLQGNKWGVIHMVLAGTGEFLAGRIVHNIHRNSQPASQPSTVSVEKSRLSRGLDKCFGGLELMNWPLRVMDRLSPPPPLASPQAA